MPRLNKSIELQHPDIPFQEVAVHMTLAPVWGPAGKLHPDDGRIGDRAYTTAVVYRIVPYRILPDGTVEKNEIASINGSIGDSHKEAVSDPLVAELFAAIDGAFERYIEAKGL